MQPKSNTHYRAAINVALIAVGLTLSGCAEKLSREDFTTRTKDKTEQEISKVMGKPARIDDADPTAVKWIYPDRTFNIEKGNSFDARAIVVFGPASPGSDRKAQDVMFD